MISEAQDRLILDMAARGCTQTEIGHAAHCSRFTVANVVAYGDVRPRHPRRAFDAGRAVDLYRRVDLKPKTIAQMMGVGGARVREAIRSDVEPTPPPRPPERIELGKGHCPTCGHMVYLPCRECELPQNNEREKH